MYLPQNDVSEVVLRQRNRRDNLSKELTKNKSKLNAVRQEYRFLTHPLNTDYVDECERLDDEIDKLRRVCQVMLNEIEHLKRSQEPQNERQPVRPAPPPPPYPPPRLRPQTLFPKDHATTSLQLSPRSSECCSSSSVSPNNRHDNESPPPPEYCPKTIDDDINDNDNLCDANCGEQPWQCSMCTFQNHPLLNKCECCDNVRVLPGSLKSLKSVPSRPPPPIPFVAASGSRSAPLTPATPMASNAAASGPSSSACVLSSRSTEYTRPGVTNSSSEGSMPQFLGDVII